jgi:hypothetical protein
MTALDLVLSISEHIRAEKRRGPDPLQIIMDPDPRSQQ